MFAEAMRDKYHDNPPLVEPCPGAGENLDLATGENKCAICWWNRTYPSHPISSFMGDTQSLLNRYNIYEVLQDLGCELENACPDYAEADIGESVLNNTVLRPDVLHLAGALQCSSHGNIIARVFRVEVSALREGPFRSVWCH